MPLKEIFRRTVHLGRKSRFDQELQDELRFHLESREAELVKDGMDPDEAPFYARKQFGNGTRILEETRSVWQFHWMEEIWLDLRQSTRSCLRSPGFAGTVIICLALAIGANTAIFSLIDKILLNPLPYPSADRLVMLWTTSPGNQGTASGVSVPDYVTWSTQSRSFEAIGSIIAVSSDLGKQENGSPAEKVHGQAFSSTMFQVVGVRPILGRFFTEDEDRVDGSAPVVLISYSLWQRRFGATSDILGKQLRVDSEDLTVVGVMPQHFSFLDDECDYWRPAGFSHFQLQGSSRFLTVAARLKEGISVDQAQSDMTRMAIDLGHRRPRTDAGWGIRVQPLREAATGSFKQPLLILQGAVGLVLLIACANVAALLLARTTARRSEISVRLALGASRSRLVRQLLTESLFLSALGGLVGVPLAFWGLQLLLALSPASFPHNQRAGINGEILGCTAAVTLLTGFVFGLTPALQASNPNLAVTLNESGRGAMTSIGRNRIRAGLVTIQIAVALVLLVGAGLMINSFLSLKRVDLGFNAKSVMTFQVRYPRKDNNIKSIGLYDGFTLLEISPSIALSFDRIRQRLQQVPDVEIAAGVNRTPVDDSTLRMNFGIEGRSLLNSNLDSQKESYSAAYFLATPNYFRAMNIPVLQGRDFGERDTATAPWVVIINKAMAHRFWPNGEPIGQHLTLDLVPEEQPREIVAIVADTKLTRWQKEPVPIMYIPQLQEPVRYRVPFGGERLQMTYLLKLRHNPASLVPTLQQLVAEVNPDLSVADVRTMDDLLGQELGESRYYMVLLAIFGALATVLVSVGLYGMMAYAVAQRTREIGIRMCLGAQPFQILGLVLRFALLLVSCGLLLGLVGAAMLTSVISRQLWGVTPTDTATLVEVSVLLGTIALIACLVPAYRALRIDPLTAVRCE